MTLRALGFPSSDGSSSQVPSSSITKVETLREFATTSNYLMQPKKCVLLVALQAKLMCAIVFHANIHTCHAAKAKHVRLLEVQFCVNKNGQKEQTNRSDGAEITIQGINIFYVSKTNIQIL